jgi:hypothetical protein
MTTSASWSRLIAVLVAYSPETPIWNGSLPASQVFAISEVAMSAPERSASFRIASPAPDQRAPRPATITGRLALEMSSMARFTDSESGPGARFGRIVEEGWYGSSSSKSFCWMSMGQESMTGFDSSCAM